MVDTSAFDPNLFMAPETGRNPQDFYKVARSVGAVVPGIFGRYTIMGRSEVEYALQHPDDLLLGHGGGGPRAIGAAHPAAGGPAGALEVPQAARTRSSPRSG